MNLIYMNSVAPGVCNYVNETTMALYHNKITSIFEKINIVLNLLTPNMKESVLEKIKAAFFNLNQELRGIDKQFRVDNFSRVKLPEPDLIEYMNAFDRSHNVQFYKSGETINNKTFSRKDYELLNSLNSTNIANTLDFRINMLSKYGNKDLMTEIEQYDPIIMNAPAHESMITLEELLNYLSDLKIKNVVIFDYSCSSFVADNTIINNSRDVRNLRMELQKEQSMYTVPNNYKRLKLNVPTSSSSSSSSSTKKTTGGKRGTRKNRKSRKNRKNRKSRKIRK
jgi:hypothetical protein